MQVLERKALQNSITWFLQVLDAVLLPAAPEGGLIDTENGSGFLKRACRRQDVTDMFFFNLVQGYGVSQFDRCLPRLQVVREVATIDLIAAAKNDGSFNNVT